MNGNISFCHQQAETHHGTLCVKDSHLGGAAFVLTLPIYSKNEQKEESVEPVVLRFSFSADERATLFCDGEVIADGPPRGTPERWFTATVELPLALQKDPKMVGRPPRGGRG